MICCAHGGDNSTTEWTKNFIVDQGPQILVELPGLKPSSITKKYSITPGNLNATVRLSKSPKIKEEWKIEKTTYSLTGTGADFGAGGFPSTGEQTSPSFVLVFDYKPEFSGKTKECTLFAQVKLYGYEYRMRNGKEERTGTTATDSGVSGKDTDPTLSLTY